MSGYAITITDLCNASIIRALPAGKTTLLNLLRAQTPYAYTTGTIRVNGRDESLANFRSQMAFVPQDDILYEDLTVEENVLYAAVLFNRRNYRQKRDCLVLTDYALHLLGIDHVKYVRVGSPEERGVSGGQKKRCSVAVEMTKEAALFFLDGMLSASNRLLAF